MAGKASAAEAQDRRWERNSRIARRIGSALGGPVERRIERHLLLRAWQHFDPERLKGYLVRGYQNPVINVQSILARHELIRELYGDTHDAVMDAELQWVADRHRALRARQRALQEETGKDFSQVKKSKKWRQAYTAIMVDQDQFAAVWTEALRKLPSRRLAVIEAACGSANDYRFFRTYGLAPLLDYTGLDLTPANIDNARQMFPGVDFRIGDVQKIDAVDRSYDWAVAHDLLEHLSLAACNRVIDELCRIAGRGVLISFFRMGRHSEHKVHAERFYHVNHLSRDRIHGQFERHCTDIRWIHVRTFLEERTGFSDYYNNNAWTLIARR
jgi:SAM-dependent methyltransferase